jgi:hypothetical protein
MNQQIIGITGKKFSGKDTTGEYLIDKYNYKRFAFADVIKDICKTIFGFDDEQLHGNKKETVDEYWDTTPRELLQFIGTDLFRNQIGTVLPKIGENIWVEVLKKKIIDRLKNNPDEKIVVTDVRFQNELQMIKDLGGCIVRINRTSEINISNENSSNVHISESFIDDFAVDYDILNNGSLEDLHEKIINMSTKN